MKAGLESYTKADAPAGSRPKAAMLNLIFEQEIHLCFVMQEKRKDRNDAQNTIGYSALLL